MAVYKGDASLVVQDLLGTSQRLFRLRTVNDDSAAADRTSWELNNGGTITLYYRESTSGVAPPAAPDTIRLRVFIEDSDSGGALVRELHNGPPPANGTAFTFHGTANGLAGGGDRCGTVRMRIDAIRTSGAGGVGNYNRNSDNGQGSGLTASSFDKGALRVNAVVTLDHDGYPAGATYAYGAAGDESVTLRINHPEPYGQNPVRIELTDSVGTVIDSEQVTVTGTTTTLTHVIGSALFADGSATYGFRATPVGTTPLFTQRWTHFVAGPGASQFGVDAVEDLDLFIADPRITISTVNTGKALYNRGEATTIDLSIVNARNESLTRSVPFILRNSLGASRYTVSDTGSNYDINYTTTSTDDASFDTVGKQWTVETNLSDTYNESANVWKLSRKLLLGNAIGSNNGIVQTDEEVYNRGETVTMTFNVSYARGEALASRSINIRVHDNGSPSNQEDVQVKTTSGSGGITNHTYVIGSGDKATFDAVGSPKHLEVDWSGNTTDDSQEEWGVSNKLVIPGYIDATNTGDFWTGKSDLDVDVNGEPDSSYESDFFVGADVLYSKVRVQNIRNVDYDDADVTAWLIRNTTIEQGPVTGAVTQTESGFTGYQDLFYSFDVKAPAGARILRVEVTKDGNTTGNNTFGGYLTRNVNFAPSYTGNLFLEVNYEAHELVKDSVRFTVTPVIFSTANVRQLLSTVSPAATIDIAPQFHVTVPEASGAPTLILNQATMTNITNDDQWEGTITGLSAHKGKTVHVHVVMTLNGGQIQASFPIIVGPMKNKKVLTKFNPALGSVNS